MILKTLELTNFQGIRSFKLDTGGRDASIFGTNGVGKTTLFSGVKFLLFGEDALGRTDFAIKTLDENGQPIHNLDHTVEATLALGDGQEITLKRVYAEDWVKKRGSATRELTGHSTKFFVDGVPCGTKTEYDRRIAEIAEKDRFRLLTDPAAFPSLHWKEQRELLLSISGDVTDDEVIASNKKLTTLPGILGKRTLDEHRRVVEARRREINQELKELPARIDEVHRGLPDLTDTAADKLNAELGRLREHRAEIQEEQIRVQAGGEIAEKRKRLTEIQADMQTVTNRAAGVIEAKAREAREKAGAIQDREDGKAREVRRLEGELEDAKARIATLTGRLSGLREEYGTIKARTFEHTHDENCPVCEQALPAEQVQAAHQKALEEFNARQSRELEANKTAGVAAKAERDRLESQVADLQTAITEAIGESTRLQGEAQDAQAEAERLQKAVPDVTVNPEHKRLAEEHAQIEQAIQSLRTGTQEALDQITERLAGVDEQISNFEAQIATIDHREKDLTRIAELEAQEKKLAAEYGTLEGELYLTDQFIRSKVHLLEERINGQFEICRFKLFKTLVNGGLEETTEIMVNGVPYSSLNHGARVNAGLDLIRTLQRYFGFHAPVWIDNCESVVQPLDMECQVIRLIVSGKDQKLRVAVNEREAVAA